MAQRCWNAAIMTMARRFFFTVCPLDRYGQYQLWIACSGLRAKPNSTTNGVGTFPFHASVVDAALFRNQRNSPTLE